MTSFVRLPIRDWLQALTDTQLSQATKLPTNDEKAALDAANSPSAGNPLVTMSDLVVATPAESGQLNAIALETVSALTAVADAAGGVVVARDGWVSGISRTSAPAGEMVSVQVAGPMSDASWHWTPLQPIFVDTNGRLTQIAPQAGQITVVAVAVSATQITLHLQPPANLA